MSVYPVMMSGRRLMMPSRDTPSPTPIIVELVRLPRMAPGWNPNAAA